MRQQDQLRELLDRRPDEDQSGSRCSSKGNSASAHFKRPAGKSTSVRSMGEEMRADAAAYAFGLPQGVLGGTAANYLGRTKLKFGGSLSGTAPVLAWVETGRYPNELESIAGISGGPVIDEKGNVVGIIVAASVGRGRVYTVAPEILRGVMKQLQGTAPLDTVPVRSLVTPPVSLSASAESMKRSARIVETYCIPE